MADGLLTLPMFVHPAFRSLSKKCPYCHADTQKRTQRHRILRPPSSRQDQDYSDCPCQDHSIEKCRQNPPDSHIKTSGGHQFDISSSHASGKKGCQKQERKTQADQAGKMVKNQTAAFHRKAIRSVDNHTHPPSEETGPGKGKDGAHILVRNQSGPGISHGHPA